MAAHSHSGGNSLTTCPDIRRSLKRGRTPPKASATPAERAKFLIIASFVQECPSVHDHLRISTTCLPSGSEKANTFP